MILFTFPLSFVSKVPIYSLMYLLSIPVRHLGIFSSRVSLMIFSFYTSNLWWHQIQNLGRHIPDFIPALWKVRKCIKYGKVKENSVKNPNVENCISVLLWFIIRLSVLKKILHSQLILTNYRCMNFLLFFFLYFAAIVLWRKFFSSIQSL